MFHPNAQPFFALKRFFQLMLIICLPVCSFAQAVAHKKLSLLNGKVEISFPAELTEMTNENWKKKYGSAEKPFLALSDKKLELSMIAHQTGQEWVEAEMNEYVQFRIDNFKNNRLDAKVLEHGVKDVNGKKVGFIKFETKPGNTVIFNYYFFAVLDGQMLLFSFNTPETLKAQWEKPADEILGSLKIK